MRETACKRFYVSGRVQGVFFRASTREKALALGLVGWAKNLADGRVEVLAYGAESALVQLETWLWQGPEFAHVEQLDKQECKTDYDQPLQGFAIF